MAFEPGKGQVFKIDNAAGSLQDVSTYLTDIDFPEEADTEETTTLGKNAKTYLVTLTDATISVEGKWDATADAIFAGIVGHATTKTFEYGPQGGTAGKVRYTGECICTKYQLKGSVGGVEEFTAEFQCSDTVTRDTY